MPDKCDVRSMTLKCPPYCEPVVPARGKVVGTCVHRYRRIASVYGTYTYVSEHRNNKGTLVLVQGATTYNIIVGSTWCPHVVSARGKWYPWYQPMVPVQTHGTGI